MADTQYKQYIIEFKLYDGTTRKIPIEIPMGEDGGFYTPATRKVSDTEIEISFTPSKDGMPAVEPVTVSAGNVADLTGYATEQWVKDQKYMTEVPDGYAKTEDIPSLDGYAKTEDVPTDAEIIQLINDNSPEPSGGGIAVTGAKVGQTVKISAVDENGVPTAWLPTDFPSGGGSGGGDVWEEILDITLSEDTMTVTLSQDKNGNAFSLKKVFMKFIPAYGADNKTSGAFRVTNEAGVIDAGLDDTRTQGVLLYIDEVHIIMSKHYDSNTWYFDTYAIKTHQLSRNENGTPISKFAMEYPNVTYYAGTKITVWGVRA